MVARTWSAAAAGAWSDPNNWSPAGVPADGDAVIFDGTSTQHCTIDVPTARLAGFSMNAGYTGIITAAAKVSVNFAPGGNFSQAAGSFLLQSQTLEVDGAFTRTGGTFDAGTGLMRFGGSVTQGPSFTIGTSTGEFFRDASIGGTSFWDLIIDAGVTLTTGVGAAPTTVDNRITVNGTCVIGTGAVFVRLILRNMSGIQDPILLGPNGTFFGEPNFPDSALISFQNAGAGTTKQPTQFLPGGKYVACNIEINGALADGRLTEIRLTGPLFGDPTFPSARVRFTNISAGRRALFNTQSFDVELAAVDTAGSTGGDFGIQSSGGTVTLSRGIPGLPVGANLANGFWRTNGAKIVIVTNVQAGFDGTTPTYDWDDVDLLGAGPISFVKNITTRSILARVSATISPSAGITWTLKAGASLSASPGNLLTLQSASPPTRFFVAAQGSLQAVRVSLRDVDASQGARIYAFDPEDVDAGNNVNVVFRSRSSIADVAGGAVSEVHFLTRTASVLNPAVPADHQRYVYFMKQWSREPDAVVVSVYENLANVLTIKDQQLLLPNQTIPVPRDGPRPQAVMVIQASSFPQVELSGATVTSGVGLQLFYEDRPVGAKPQLPIQVLAPS